MVGRRLPTLALFLALIAGLLHGVAATAGDLTHTPFGHADLFCDCGY